MKCYLMAQYTPEWWEARRGVPTASEFDKILTPTGRLSAQAKKYAARLVADRVNLSPNAFSDRRIGTAAMEAGRLTEPEARQFYQMHRGVDVQQVGFVVSDCGRFGCSPDGLVGFQAGEEGWGREFKNGLELSYAAGIAEGALELKCPLLETHATYLLEGPDYLPSEYKPQVHGQLIVTGLPWVDFLSYGLGLQPHLVRVEPTEYTRALRQALSDFLQVLEDVTTQLLGPAQAGTHTEKAQ